MEIVLEWERKRICLAICAINFVVVDDFMHDYILTCNELLCVIIAVGVIGKIKAFS